MQVAAGLVGRHAACFVGGAGKVAGTAIGVRVQAPAFAVTAGLDRFIAGRFAGCSISTADFAFFAVRRAGAGRAIALLAVGARRDALVATALLPIRTIGDASALGGIADLALGAGDAGFAAADLAGPAVVHTVAGGTGLATLALIDANAGAALLPRRTGRLAHAIDRTEPFTGGAFVVSADSSAAHALLARIDARAILALLTAGDAAGFALPVSTRLTWTALFWDTAVARADRTRVLAGIGACPGRGAFLARAIAGPATGAGLAHIARPGAIGLLAGAISLTRSARLTIVDTGAGVRIAGLAGTEAARLTTAAKQGLTVAI